MRFLSNLRKAKFDLVIDLQGLFRTGFFGWATGCKRCMGIKDCRELASFFYTTAIGPCSDSDHVIEPVGLPVTKNSKFITRPVFIEDNCWIGQNAAILKGVTIGQGSIVGANSVVTHDVPSHSVVAGNPARIIKRLDVSVGIDKEQK